MNKKQNVLILCSGNSCRSQMAEAFLRKHGGDRFNVFSAGLRPTEIHPLTFKVMAERGLDLAGQRSKSGKEYLVGLSVAHLIIVCDQAEQDCPHTMPGARNRLFWPFKDPAAAVGDKLEVFREIRDQIEGRILTWLDKGE